MNEQGHRECVEAIRSFIFLQSVPNSSCQMGQDGMLNCSLLPRNCLPPPRYYSPNPLVSVELRVLITSNWNAPQIMLLSSVSPTSKSSGHPAPIRAPSVRMVQARSLLAHPHWLFRSALLWEPECYRPFQNTSSLLQVAFEWMKTSSQGARGSEGCSLTRWKSLRQSALTTTKSWPYCFHDREMANKVPLRDASARAQLPFAAINSVLLLPVNISCSSEIVNPNVSVGGE